MKEEENFIEERERERGSAAHSLPKVFGQLLVMEVVKLAVKVLVAEGRGGERERGEKGSAKSRNEGGFGFLVYFGPNFLLPQIMKIKSIYRRGKRDILSLVVPNLGHWFDPKASQLLVESSKDELSILCMKIVGRVGHFRAVPPPLKSRSA